MWWKAKSRAQGLSTQRGPGKGHLSCPASLPWRPWCAPRRSGGPQGLRSERGSCFLSRSRTVLGRWRAGSLRDAGTSAGHLAGSEPLARQTNKHELLMAEDQHAVTQPKGDHKLAPVCRPNAAHRARHTHRTPLDSRYLRRSRGTHGHTRPPLSPSWAPDFPKLPQGHHLILSEPHLCK